MPVLSFSRPSDLSRSSESSGFVDLHIVLTKSSYSSHNSLLKSLYSLLRDTLHDTLVFKRATL